MIREIVSVRMVFCWWPTEVWASLYCRDGFVWMGRARRVEFGDGTVLHFRTTGDTK